MKIAFIATSEYACPAPSNRIQAALWVCQQNAEGVTRRGYETTYIGMDGSSLHVTNIAFAGTAFFDLYTYESWVKFDIAKRIRTLQSHQAKLMLYAIDYCNKNSFDIVHIHTSPPAFSLPYINYISGPKVITLHDPLDTKYKPVMTENYSDQNHFVSISHAQRAPMPKLSYIDNVYNGISIDDYVFSGEKGKHFMFLGRMTRYKGIREAVEVAVEANEKLVIVGKAVTSESDYTDRYVLPHVDNELIQLTGVVGMRKKVLDLQRAKALLFPIRWEEPFGLVMIEAMACGTPVIAFNRGSVSEVVVDGVTGFIIDPDDVDRPGKGSWVIKQQGKAGIIEAMKRIDRIDRSACREHVKKHFSIEQMVEGYERVYKRVVKSL